MDIPCILAPIFFQCVCVCVVRTCGAVEGCGHGGGREGVGERARGVRERLHVGKHACFASIHRLTLEQRIGQDIRFSRRLLTRRRRTRARRGYGNRSAPRFEELNQVCTKFSKISYIASAYSK
jgi:hypothetical protein